MMKVHALRPYTIIPNELYVARRADRQLQNNLIDMGRPAYVLVARQMGKTNLLLNAKRNSPARDVFCYVDVSNELPDLRSFLRNIVDLILDSHGSKFGELVGSIRDKRRSSELPVEHKEHENELRVLLSAFEGKLVICLDEIDALTKTSYSDKAFSLIRSMYFSGRTNFPEFNRVTYVLSGVAEPTEIIKDRNISPFNIGEKIYLSDFEYGEVVSLLTKAGLHFTKEVTDRIYHWTSGNPRMTWDVCAELASLEHDILASEVNLIVRKLYLTSFDLPPVDHIRSLVETDQEIREAIIAIHYRRSGSISDAVRTKLYLAGITGNVSDVSNEVQIKNRIIEEALSEAWLKDMEARGLDLREQAMRLYREREFIAALAKFLAFEERNSVIEDEAAFRYYKGDCYYELEEYESAINEFEGASTSKSSSSDRYFNQRLKLASCFLRSNQEVRAAELLGALLEEIERDFGAARPVWYFQAHLIFAATCFSHDPPDHEAVVTHCESVVSELAVEGLPLDIDLARNFKNAAWSNLIAAYAALGRRDDALSTLDRAAFGATLEEQACLLLLQATRFSDRVGRESILERCVRTFVASDTQVRSAHVDEPNRFSFDTASKLLIEVAAHSNGQLLEEYFDDLLHKRRITPDQLFEVLTAAASEGLQSNRSSAARRVLQKIGDLKEIPEHADARYLVSIAILFAGEFSSDRLESIYLEKFLSKHAPIAQHEHRVVFLATHRHILQGHLTRAREIYEAGRRAFTVALEADSASFGDLEHYAFDYLDLATSSRAIAKSDIDGLVEKIRIVKDVPPYYVKGFVGELLNLVRGLDPDYRQRPAVRGFKFGRNQLVKVRTPQGEVLSGKFKRFEEALRAGKVELVDGS